MNLQSIVVVVLRLMALNCVLDAVVQMMPQMLQVLGIYESSRGPHSLALAVFPWLVLVAMIVAAVLLWILALPLARLVTRGVSHDLSFGSLSLIDCYSIAFMAVGLFYISSHLPQVLNWTHYLFKAAASDSGDRWKEGVQWYDVSAAFIPFIIGVVLFVKGRSWAVALARRQEKPESPNQTMQATAAPPRS